MTPEEIQALFAQFNAPQETPSFGLPIGSQGTLPPTAEAAPPVVEPAPSDSPLDKTLASIGTADLIDADEAGRKAARIDAAEELMATNPYQQEAAPSLVQETPDIDFEALIAQLSKAGS